MALAALVGRMPVPAPGDGGGDEAEEADRKAGGWRLQPYRHQPIGGRLTRRARLDCRDEGCAHAAPRRGWDTTFTSLLVTPRLRSSQAPAPTHVRLRQVRVGDNQANRSARSGVLRSRRLADDNQKGGPSDGCTK